MQEPESEKGTILFCLMDAGASLEFLPEKLPHHPTNRRDRHFYCRLIVLRTQREDSPLLMRARALPQSFRVGVELFLVHAVDETQGLLNVLFD